MSSIPFFFWCLLYSIPIPPTASHLHQIVTIEEDWIPMNHLLAACQQSSNSAFTKVAQKPNCCSQHAVFLAILEEIGSQKLQQTRRMATPKPNFGLSSFVSAGYYFQSKCLEVCHDQLLQANDKPNLKATTLKCRGSKHLRCTVEV